MRLATKPPNPKAAAQIDARAIERRELAEANYQLLERLGKLEARDRRRDQEFDALEDRLADLEGHFEGYKRRADAERRDELLRRGGQRYAVGRLLEWLEEYGNKALAVGSKDVADVRLRARKGQGTTGARLAKRLAEAFGVDPDDLPTPAELSDKGAT